MSETTKFKQRIILISCFLSFTVSFVAVGAVAVLLFSSKETPEVPQFVVPLIAEPNLLDFQDVDAGDHEGIVYLVNQSKQKINLLFVRSSCTCGVVELPGKTILPSEKMPVKCTLSTAGRTGTVGGEIFIAYRFADSDEASTSPMYVRITLRAVVNRLAGEGVAPHDTDII